MPLQATLPVVGAGILMDRGQLGVFHTSTLGLQKRVLIFFLISSCVPQWVSKRIGPKQTCHSLCWYQWSLIWTSHGLSCQVLPWSCHGLTYSSLTPVEILFYWQSWLDTSSLGGFLFCSTSSFCSSGVCFIPALNSALCIFLSCRIEESLSLEGDVLLVTWWFIYRVSFFSHYHFSAWKRGRRTLL